MKMLCALVGVAAVSQAAGANLRSSHARDQAVLAPANASLLQGSETAAAELVKQVLSSRVGLREALAHVHDRMTIQDAERRLTGKLPQDVASLLKVRKQEPTFDEASLAKALRILNKMVQDSFAELDGVIIECKAFENMNRMGYGQVATDLARLGSETAEAEEMITENYNCIGQQDKEYRAVSDNLNDKRMSYERTKADNDATMTVRRNDLAVFNFIMDLTKCKDGTTFLQEADAGNASAPMRVCSTQDGIELDFTDPKIQAKANSIMTPGAKQAINAALGMAFASGGHPAAFVQGAQAPASSSPAPAPVTTTPPAIEFTLPPTPVREEPPQSVQWKKCTDGPVNCGLLHDTMSLQWGKFKDLVDALQAEMDKNRDAWDELRENLNEQMDVIAGQKGECQTGFNQATGKKNILTAESNEKTLQMHELNVDYDHYMGVCHARIEELLFTDVCAVRKVRNEVMKKSTVSPTSAIIDCDVADWVAEECSVPCDDTCPHKVGGQVDPFSCGGKQTLTRSVIVSANQWGIVCPALSLVSRCGQYKCPVDCHMSEWSGWSKCTKDCEGGSRQRTRSVLTKPKNGGQFCDSPVDTEPCNTGSCDRDCSLDAWTAFSPCSMACNPGGMPGFKERARKVVVPIRGEGKCPAPDSAARYDKQTCNEQACIGDEICVAKQDLIIALDASGSLRESGFEIVRDFAVNLTGFYKPMYYGQATVQLGVIEFGNGARMGDGSIAPALNVVGLTGDLALVKSKIQATTWQKGFTNMAQAFVLADTMFQQGGRPDAQSAVLVLSDGKYSFAFETENAVNKLKEKGTMVYMAPISDRAGDWQHKLKEWASQPWETNFELLPGLESVKHNMALFSAALVAKFCPEAISPSQEAIKSNRTGYTLIHEGGFPSDSCGRWYNMGNVDTLADCAQKAQSVNYLAFSITEPSPYYGGKRHCYAEAIPVTRELWNKWIEEKADVPCPGGTWLGNPNYDVYALEPLG